MNTSFIRDEIELLSRHFRLDVRIGAGVRAPLDILRRARRADISFSWFGSVYTFFMVLGAKLGRGGSIIVLGGVDTAKDPELGYGIWLSRWKGVLLRWALRNADKVLAVDASLIDELRRSSGWDAARVEVLPTGYDIDRLTPGDRREDLVLTVAVCDTVDRAKLKGIDLMIAAAAQLPDVRFRAIGIHPHVIDAMRDAAPPNIELLPPVPREELITHYRAATIYCQVSRREGLPNALCEAMLCGCIPVGTRVGGIPTAIGQTGFVIAKGDLDGLCRSIRSGLAMPREASDAARDRIARLFSRERREKALVGIINGIAA
jgi:glycosyltransferase involved in cell wall biosynthesis